MKFKAMMALMSCCVLVPQATHATVIQYDAVIDLSQTNFIADGFLQVAAPPVSLNKGDEIHASISFANGQALHPLTILSPPTVQQFGGFLVSALPNASQGSSTTSFTGVSGTPFGPQNLTVSYTGTAVGFAQIFLSSSDFQFTGLDFSSIWTGDSFQGNSIVLLTNSPMQLVTSAVPEPSSWAMMIAGFGFVGAATRRYRRMAVRGVVYG